MTGSEFSNRAATQRDPMLWHLALIALLSIGFEWNFLDHGLNQVDEGWPLYAAMRLHQGGSLYQDVYFVFPPGHVLSAWLAYAIDPPGVIAARYFYSFFNLAACLALYVLGRRIMPAPYALLGAALLAVAAPSTHHGHMLFGYRYLVFSLLALVAFHQRLVSGNTRWLYVAGGLVGVQLCFRPTPAMAAACGLVIGVLAASPNWKVRISDGLRLAAGGLAVAGPVVAWLLLSVGPETLWRELAARPFAMTILQEKPIPKLFLPMVWKRHLVSRALTAFLFRACAILYATYLAVLLWGWARAILRREAYQRAFLLAVTVFGAFYYTRSLGRSDEPHLMSAIPPFCLLAAHAVGVLTRRVVPPDGSWGRQFATAAICLGVFGTWSTLGASTRVLEPDFMGRIPALGGATTVHKGKAFDDTVAGIVRHSEPGDTMLVLGPASLLYVVSERTGPGWHDVIMPGTFLDETEEVAFVARLREDPPDLIVRRRNPLPFDGMPERNVEGHASELTSWVRENYSSVEINGRYIILKPRAAAPDNRQPELP
jgi:hypothetical protein